MIRSNLLSQKLWISLLTASDFQKNVELCLAFENTIEKSKKSFPVWPSQLGVLLVILCEEQTQQHQ